MSLYIVIWLDDSLRSGGVSAAAKNHVSDKLLRAHSRSPSTPIAQKMAIVKMNCIINFQCLGIQIFSPLYYFYLCFSKLQRVTRPILLFLVQKRLNLFSDENIEGENKCISFRCKNNYGNFLSLFQGYPLPACDTCAMHACLGYIYVPDLNIIYRVSLQRYVDFCPHFYKVGLLHILGENVFFDMNVVVRTNCVYILKCFSCYICYICLIKCSFTEAVASHSSYTFVSCLEKTIRMRTSKEKITVHFN